MSYRERQEYVHLIGRARWDVASTKRLHELRVWKDAQVVPPEFQSKVFECCSECGDYMWQPAFESRCSNCSVEEIG